MGTGLPGRLEAGRLEVRPGWTPGSNLETTVGRPASKPAVVEVVSKRSIRPRSLGPIATFGMTRLVSRSRTQQDMQCPHQYPLLEWSQLAVAIEIEQAQDPAQTRRSRGDIDLRTLVTGEEAHQLPASVTAFGRIQSLVVVAVEGLQQQAPQLTEQIGSQPGRMRSLRTIITGISVSRTRGRR